GPILTLSKAAEFSFGFGGFGEFNFTANRAPETFIPGLGVKATWNKGNTIGVTGYLFGKMFILGQSSTAITLAPEFAYTKVTGGSSTSFGLSGGLSTYF